MESNTAPLSSIGEAINSSPQVDLEAFSSAMSDAVGVSFTANQVSAETNAAIAVANKIGDAFNKLR